MRIKTVQTVDYAVAEYDETLDLRLLDLLSAQGRFGGKHAFVSIPYAIDAEQTVNRSAKVTLQKTSRSVVDAVEKEIGGPCVGITCQGSRKTKSIRLVAEGVPAWGWIDETMHTLAALQASCDT